MDLLPMFALQMSVGVVLGWIMGKGDGPRD